MFNGIKVLMYASALAIFSAFAALPATAQVYATGPNGVGYITTTQPISPDCVAPQTWTLSNGYYSCQNPPPPPPPPSGNPGGSGPTATDANTICTASFASYTIPAADQSLFSSQQITLFGTGPFSLSASWIPYNSVSESNPQFPYEYLGFPADTAYSSNGVGPAYKGSIQCNKYTSYRTYCMVNSNGTVDAIGAIPSDASLNDCH